MIFLRAVASAEIATSKTAQGSDVALTNLLVGVRAHESSLSAIRVLEDSKDGGSNVAPMIGPVIKTLTY